MFKYIKKVPIYVLNVLLVMAIYIITKLFLWQMELISDLKELYLETIVFFCILFIVTFLLYRGAARNIRIIYQGLNQLTINHNYRLEKMPGLWGRVSERINQLADSIVNTRNLMNRVLNNLPIPVLVADKEGEIKICNHTAKQLFLCQGCTKDAFPKQCLQKLLKWSITTDKPIVNYDYYLELPNGKKLYLLINTKTLTEPNDEGLTVLLTAMDITTKQQLWDQIQHIEKISMISDLAAGVAHEIKNPLTGARGILQLINERFNEEDVARQHIKVALESLNRINAIINEMELLSHPNKPNLSFNQLENLLEEISLLIDSDAVIHNVTVKKIYQPELPLAVIDIAQMKQVFLNLAVNAINAMPQGGELTISVNFNFSNDEFMISFADQGIGMTNAEINKIFNPFYSSCAENTGLGLSISYQIIKNHGGRIIVQSEKGKGSVFTIYLPAVKQEKMFVKTKQIN